MVSVHLLHVTVFLKVSMSKASQRKCHPKRSEKKAIAFKNLLLNSRVYIETENELVTRDGRIIFIFLDNVFALASSCLISCPFAVKQVH